MTALPPRAYAAVDRGSKLLGLVLVTAALGGAAGDWALPVALLGVALGVGTVFVDVADGETDGDDAGADDAAD